MNKYWLPLAAAVCIGAIPAQGQNIAVRVNGDRVRFQGAGPQEIQGRVMVPLRGVLEQMGAYVDWNQATQTVIANRGDMTMRLPIGSRTAYVNGNRVSLDVPAMTLGGNTMVPLRFVGEALGAEVRWDNRTETVLIDTPDGNVNGRAHRDRIDNGVDRPAIDRPAIDRRTRDDRLPMVTSVSSNLRGRWLLAGDSMRVHMRATPDGKAFFRIQGVVGEIKMNEISPGVYEGVYRNDTNHDIEINRNDVLAFVTVGDRASAETHLGSSFP